MKNAKPLLIFILAEDGIFELGQIWSVLHRQASEFDLVLVDQTGGKTKVPKPILQTAVKTVTVGTEGLGKTINAICGETNNGFFIFTTDRVFPTHDHWVKRLCEPLLNGTAEAVFGRQISAPGGNYFLNRDIEDCYPAEGVLADPALFSIDNCAITRDAILKNPFPENVLRDPAAAWRAANGMTPAYSPAAIVMRYTLLTLHGIYDESRSASEETAPFAKKPSITSTLGGIARGVWKDSIFALSLKKPQYLWYPPFRQAAKHFGHYFGARKK